MMVWMLAYLYHSFLFHFNDDAIAAVASVHAAAAVASPLPVDCHMASAQLQITWKITINVVRFLRYCLENIFISHVVLLKMGIHIINIAVYSFTKDDGKNYLPKIGGNWWQALKADYFVQHDCDTIGTAIWGSAVGIGCQLEQNK